MVKRIRLKMVKMILKLKILKKRIPNKNNLKEFVQDVQKRQARKVLQRNLEDEQENQRPKTKKNDV